MKNNITDLVTHINGTSKKNYTIRKRRVLRRYF